MNLKLNFCTLFNSNYLSRGLVLYNSLLKCCSDFHLYVFAFDDKTFEFINAQNYEHLTVVSLSEFEDIELLGIKPTRSKTEYCWTCASSTILFSIEKFNLQSCTYIDADMFFYSDPKVLIEEMGDKSVLITEHRYTPKYDQSKTSGIFCVQFVTFRNDEKGLKVLHWWRNACIEWCYARFENGKFGDQKYLDDWNTRFEGIHLLKNLGAGLAPWNIQQYRFNLSDNLVEGMEIKTEKYFTPIFFHFHSLKFRPNNYVELADSQYKLNKFVIRLFYKNYVRKLIETEQFIASKSNTTFDINISTSTGVLYEFKKVTKNIIYNLMVFFKLILNIDTKFQIHYNNLYKTDKFIGKSS